MAKLSLESDDVLNLIAKADQLRPRGGGSLSEFRQDLHGLSLRAQAELVALLWLGQEAGAPDQWAALVNAATNLQRQGRSLPDFLLQHHHLANDWLEGAVALDLEIPLHMIRKA
jgi:hypothetical protein